MIRKIAIDQLKPGMYVHDLNCSWMDHPFFLNRFAIPDTALIKKIRAVGIKELYIDTAKGDDVPDTKTEGEVTRELQQELRRIAEAEPPQATVRSREVSLPEERGYAEHIQQEASGLVTGIMSDVRLGRQVELERVEPVVERMIASIFRNHQALISLGRIRRTDQYTFEHSVSIGVLLIAFAKAMGFERDLIRQIGIGGLLHDIGKVKVPAHILNKPGRLTDEEFALMKRHVVYSEEILSATEGISPQSIAVAAQHHERYDGTGYPRGLKGDQISLYGQMAAIIDVYDAITANRIYHKGLPPTVGLRKLLEWSKFHFNPELVQHFIRIVGIYPVGSLVRLKSGRLAVVIEPGDKGLLHPVVRIVYDADQGQYLSPKILDLSNPGQDGNDHIVNAEDPLKWGIRPELFME